MRNLYNWSKRCLIYFNLFRGDKKVYDLEKVCFLFFLFILECV